MKNRDSFVEILSFSKQNDVRNVRNIETYRIIFDDKIRSNRFERQNDKFSIVTKIEQFAKNFHDFRNDISFRNIFEIVNKQKQQ